jgi:hypothetical protein
MVPHFNEGSQDVVPGLLFHQYFIGEHATIPADVLESLGEFTILIPEPVACMSGDVQLAVGIERLAVPAGFIM